MSRSRNSEVYQCNKGILHSLCSVDDLKAETLGSDRGFPCSGTGGNIHPMARTTGCTRDLNLAVPTLPGCQTDAAFPARLRTLDNAFLGRRGEQKCSESRGVNPRLDGHT